MPFIIHCADTRCQNYVEKLGDLCPKCQPKDDQKDWRADGWTRREDNKSAQQGHKGKKDK